MEREEDEMRVRGSGDGDLRSKKSSRTNVLFILAFFFLAPS